ncbi:MAG: glycosyltransferase family 4 protein [archaeon]|nr:glycosyltransferase family 4 protein [archaeon]
MILMKFKTAFLYSGPHPVHKEWAELINADFVSNQVKGTSLNVWIIGRFVKSFSVQKTIPKNIDLLLCESGSEIIAGALWKKKNPSKKLALIVDDPKLFLLKKMNPITRSIYLWALKYFDLLIPTTDLMMEAIPQEFRSKAKMAPMYADVEFFSQKQTDLNKKNLVFVGLVGEEKGVDKIIECFKIVQKDFPKSKLIIVGNGPKRKLYESMKIKNIEFAGYQDHQKIREIFLNSNIYINLARIEPAGIAIIEAMCAGLVPIVTENVGFKEIIRKVSPELVVDSSENAAKQINRLWNDNVLLNNLSKKSVIEAKKITQDKSFNGFLNAINWLMQNENK